MKTLIKVVGALLGLLIILAIAAFFSIGFWLSPQSKLEKTDAIVAISGGETESRTREAIRLYQAGYAPKLIFSGAALDPNSPSNAKAMQLQAIEAGVPRSATILEEASANTIQNAKGVAKIVAENEFTSILLVTSPYHQRRASLTFQAELGPGVKIVNHSTTDKNWRRSKWWASEYSYNLTLSELQKALYVWLKGGRVQFNATTVHVR